MALSAYYKDHLHLEDEEEFKTMQNRILAKFCLQLLLWHIEIQ